MGAQELLGIQLPGSCLGSGRKETSRQGEPTLFPSVAPSAVMSCAGTPVQEALAKILTWIRGIGVLVSLIT